MHSLNNTDEMSKLRNLNCYPNWTKPWISKPEIFNAIIIVNLYSIFCHSFTTRNSTSKFICILQKFEFLIPFSPLWNSKCKNILVSVSVVTFIFVSRGFGFLNIVNKGGRFPVFIILGQKTDIKLSNTSKKLASTISFQLLLNASIALTNCHQGSPSFLVSSAY